MKVFNTVVLSEVNIKKMKSITKSQVDIKEENMKKVSYDVGLNEYNRLSIGSTGARAGDILIGTHKGTSGSIMKVYTDVYPAVSILNRMRYHKDIWSKFLIKLGSVDFFSQMSIEEREKWLNINEVNDDFFDESDRLHLIQPGEGDVDKKTGSIFVVYLPDEDIAKLVTKNPDSKDGHWSPMELNDIVIEYTGKTSTLIRLKTFWKISTAYTVKKKFKGPVLDIRNGLLLDGVKSLKNDKEIIVIDNITKCVKKLG